MGTRYVIAIDPGVTIGLALLSQHDGSIIETAAIDTKGEWRISLRSWLVSYDDEAEVVCEAGPSFGRHNDDILRRVEELVLNYANEVRWLTPSRWKGHPKAKLTRAETTGRTKHEHDAAGMGRVWIHLHKGEDR